MKQDAFWDASALTPLCIDQSTTPAVESLARQFSQVVWWGSAVEVHSAVARLYRSGHISEHFRLVAIARLLALTRGWSETSPDITLRTLAIALLDKHPLRAADSLQLAPGIIWCQGNPAGRTFLCSDLRLSEAAAGEGFSVIQP